MKKAFFTMAILVMAFGNMGFAQSKAEQRAKITEQIFKQYGLVRESNIKPYQANYNVIDATQYRTTYYYDEWEYTLTEEITESYSGGWTNVSRIAYEYDFNGNVLEMLSQMWLGSEWKDMTLVTYDYDGDLIKEAVYQFNVGGTWENQMKEVFNYNGDQWTMLLWNWNGNTWTSSDLYTYTRNSNTIELVVQYMEGGAWQNRAMEIFTLDFNENITEVLYKEWNSGSGIWEDVERMTYTYEGSVYTEQYHQTWDGTAWKDEHHYTFEYDENGNAKIGLCFEFNGDTWVSANGDIDIAYDYNAEKKSFHGSEVEMTYVDLTRVNENAQAANVKVYPVPAENEIFIQAEGFQKAEIYSLTGQKLMESATEKMNVGSLSQGVYLLKVFDRDGNSATQRVVVK